MLNGIVESIKPRLRLMVLSVIFLSMTTLVSLISIYVFARMNRTPIPGTGLGMIILGSIFGQITLLIAMSVIGRLKKDGSKD